MSKLTKAYALTYADSLPPKLFSGEHSASMWDAINNAKTKDDLRMALYIVCCRLQDMESKLAADGYREKRMWER